MNFWLLMFVFLLLNLALGLIGISVNVIANLGVWVACSNFFASGFVAHHLLIGRLSK